MTEQNHEKEQLNKEIELLKQKLSDCEQASSVRFSKKGENHTVSSILNAVPHAIVGLVDRKIVFANNAVKSVFNIDAVDAIGKSTRIFYRNDDDFKQIGEMFYPILEEKQVYAHEIPCRTNDGKDIICNLSVARFSHELTDLAIVAMFEDITERKKFEIELKQSEKELKRKMHDLEIFRKSAVGREMKMMEMKKKISDLEKQVQDMGNNIHGLGKDAQ